MVSRDHAYRLCRRETEAHLLPHGTVAGYNNWGCRCPACLPVGRAYMREAQRMTRQRRRQRKEHR